MLTDIEIAQSVEMRPILEIAANAGIPTEDLELYGKYKAKIPLTLLDESKPDGKLVAAGKVESGDFAKSVFRAKEPVIGEHSVFVVLFGTSELDWWIFE